MFLVSGGDIRWAHRPHMLPAGAHAVAHLHRSGEIGVDGKVQFGRHAWRTVVGAVAQVLIHGWGVDDFAGVHQAVRVESPLQLLEQLVDIRAEHFLVPNAPDDAVAVLATERSAKFLD